MASRIAEKLAKDNGYGYHDFTFKRSTQDDVMNNIIESEKLISHAIVVDDIESIIEKIATRIKSQPDKPYVTVARQLEILQQLTEFDFGRFLLQNQGINGYWTHYMLTHPWFGKKTGKNNRSEVMGELESFILNRSPTMLATQERFEIFLKANQASVKNSATLACIPCGMMGELLYLHFYDVQAIELVGIDYDPETLLAAHQLAEKRSLVDFVRLEQADAWDLKTENSFDLISSNGLTIYEPDDQKIEALFREFFKALKPGGKLVTSFLTPAPTVTDACEWDFSAINQDDLLLQKIIFVDILEMKFRCYRTTAVTKAQLESVGFVNIEIIQDKANMFPTVVAYK
jgi:SAM-dependent methyltransferase